MIVQRHPKTNNNSLKAWSSADEYLVRLANEQILPTSKIAIINDRFGFLSVQLSEYSPKIITHCKSQEESILKNFDSNEIDSNNFNFSRILDKSPGNNDLVVMKIPKSMDLFHLFLIKVYPSLQKEGKVYCGFMTRHFTKQMIEIASLYFENVEQSLAWKKSRVLKLSKPKSNVDEVEPIHSIPYTNHRDENLVFKQYFGVFSGKHIDYATQFLLANLTINPSVEKALDLASGNGVIAYEIRAQNKTVEIHLIDDSSLAVESSKLNLKTGKNHFHYNSNLDDFADNFFDLVVCNPPFHFEHENTIDIALSLFKDASRVLKPNGSFVLVANLHLNYKIQLTNIFENVEVLNMNSKFEIIRCIK